MSQKITHKVVYKDGTLVAFQKEFRVLQTKIEVWDGRNTYSGDPIEQRGITITHIVSRGDWACLNEDCDFRGTQEESMQHTTELSHVTFWEKDTI